jgi:hypothetical protein
VTALGWRHVYRWDLDKTYLDTHFESLRKLARIPFESPEEKVNIPGSAALLRELCADKPEEPPARVAIVSGSPTQMRRVLEKKLRMDGVVWHEFHLKPQWENIKRGRFRAMRNQVGYKLPLLLRSRAELGQAVPETLFGDDAEADAFIYSLYADLIADRIELGMLRKVLTRAGAYDEEVEESIGHLAHIDRADSVETIFVHLDKRTPPSRFRMFGPRLVPVYNYFQAALVLFSRRHFGSEGVVRVTRAFLEADGAGPDELANLFQDIVRRGHLPEPAMHRLGESMQARRDVAGEQEVIRKCIQRFGALGPARAYRPPAPPANADYLAMWDRFKARP